MRALICKEPFNLNYEELDIPSPLKGETLLQIKRIGICGTDLHAFEGTQPFFKYPVILGHELAATIVETDAPGFAKGESVTILPYFNCGQCIACRMGKLNCCVNMKVFGVHTNGGMREFVTVPSSNLIQGQGLAFDELALVEPLAIGVHAISRAQVMPDEFVLVVGAGPIGLGIMEFLKIAGANVIAMDVNNNRLQFCKKQIGVPFSINPLEENALECLKTITSNDMPTVIFDATGNRNAINNAFQFLSHGGRYVLVGLQTGEIVFSHPEFHKREATLMSSRNATTKDFDMVIEAIKNKKVKPGIYITHRVSFDNIKTEFANWLVPENGVIKTMVSF
jgi:2-desacetyl-2-hydroxyethyl bacteriochlorophyllide A dehydrogenase